MNFINKMERRFGRYAIHNLTKYIIGIYVLGYILEYMGRLTGFSVLSWLVLSPYHIVQGQIWRLISWVLIPPPSSNLLFVLIMLMFYYSIGTALERTWGAFRYNLYIFGGIICTVIGAFLLYAIGGPMISVYGSMAFSTYYINLSIFLAFAASYPDMQVFYQLRKKFLLPSERPRPRKMRFSAFIPQIRSLIFFFLFFYWNTSFYFHFNFRFLNRFYSFFIFFSKFAFSLWFLLFGFSHIVISSTLF